MQWNLKHKLKNNRGKTSKISHYDRKPVGLGGGVGTPVMVAGLYAFRPSLFSYLAACDLVGFGVEHRVLLGDESVELGLEQVLVDLT